MHFGGNEKSSAQLHIMLGERDFAVSTQQQKAVLKAMFDTVSGGYDNGSLRFFTNSAAHMAALLNLKGNEHILDVACGTGNAAIAIAPLLPKGRIVAVDFSTGMIEQARARIEALGIRNVEFLVRDMQHLDFPDGTFDSAVCAFGIFFVEDMVAQLGHIIQTVKPGGTAMITNFEENYFYPLKELFFARLESYGVQTPPQTWRRIAHEQGCRELFEKAGLRDIRVEKKNVGYFLADTGQWWDVVWNAGFRMMVGRLSPEDQNRFKQEHLEEIDKLRTKDGIRLDVGVLFTSGTKP